MVCLVTRALLLGTLLVLSTRAEALAQTADTAAAPLRGRIVSDGGAPVEGSNVILLETLEGALTDPAGRFAIRTAHRGIATLIVRRVGFKPRQLDITIPRVEPLT